MLSGTPRAHSIDRWIYVFRPPVHCDRAGGVIPIDGEDRAVSRRNARVPAGRTSSGAAGIVPAPVVRADLSDGNVARECTCDGPVAMLLSALVLSAFTTGAAIITSVGPAQAAPPCSGRNGRRLRVGKTRSSADRTASCSRCSSRSACARAAQRGNGTTERSCHGHCPAGGIDRIPWLRTDPQAAFARSYTLLAIARFWLGPRAHRSLIRHLVWLRSTCPSRSRSMACGSDCGIRGAADMGFCASNRPILHPRAQIDAMFEQALRARICAQPWQLHSLPSTSLPFAPAFPASDRSGIVERGEGHRHGVM